MTLEYAVAFAVAMFLWAILPGPGLAAVVSRALGSGPKAGFAVIAGLVIADVIFMGIAIVGLLAIATTMGPMFQFVKYAGAAYLVWRGYRAFVGAERPMTVEARRTSSTIFASPKSMILIFLEFVKKRFAVLMSRWMIPFSCA